MKRVVRQRVWSELQEAVATAGVLSGMHEGRRAKFTSCGVGRKLRKRGVCTGSFGSSKNAHQFAQLYARAEPFQNGF